MSGGYGPGGYPGQGYDEDSGRGRPRRRGGGQQREGSVWQNDQGYDAPGYGGQEYGGPGHDESGYNGPGTYGEYGDPGYDPRGYGQQGTGGYGYQGTGPRPGQSGQYGTGGMPQYDRPRYEQPEYGQPEYDQHATGPRGAAGGHGQGGDGGYGQRGDSGYGQGGYGDQEQEDQSFLPGFGGRDEFDADRAPGYGQERDGRYDDYDDRRGPRGARPAGRGAEVRGPGGGAGDRGGRYDDRRRDRDDRDRQPRKKATRWFPRILVLTVVAVIVVGGLVGGLDVYHKYEARYHPADYAGAGTGDVTVQVMSGDTAFSLAPRLLQLGVIASTRAFTNAAEANTSATSTSSSLEAGYYQLQYHMQASLAYTALLNPKNLVQTVVTIPEGKRVSQVLTILAAQTKIPLAQFESAAKDTAALGLPSYADSSSAGQKLPATVPYGKLEGYLFPATYAITPHETALQILQAMVQRFDVEAQQINIGQAATSVSLTPEQLIIEASMVQAEAGVDSDMPKMARVMINRKQRGMPYGFDSVVFYGLGEYGINISPGQAAAAGPYDDTQNTGLPPTPIGNPGDTAIQAVLHPASGPWLYFLTESGDKASVFSATCLPGTC